MYGYLGMWMALVFKEFNWIYLPIFPFYTRPHDNQLLIILTDIIIREELCKSAYEGKYNLRLLKTT